MELVNCTDRRLVIERLNGSHAKLPPANHPVRAVPGYTTDADLAPGIRGVLARESDFTFPHLPDYAEGVTLIVDPLVAYLLVVLFDRWDVVCVAENAARRDRDGKVVSYGALLAFDTSAEVLTAEETALFN